MLGPTAYKAHMFVVHFTIDKLWLITQTLFSENM